MEWEAKILEFLQDGSNGFFDFLMKTFTLLGDELFFILVAVTVYWCVNKRLAYKLANVYFFGAACLEGLKNIFLRARPFDKYDGRVLSIGDKTGGYSFPSGHTNSIANLSTQGFLMLKDTKHKNTALILGISATAIVMLTRMYLGQHYLTDVLVGLLVGVGLAVLFSYLFDKLGKYEDFLFAFIIPLALIVIIIFACLGRLNQVPDMLKLLGGYSAFTLGYFLEKRYVNYEVKSGKWYKQIIKIVLGLAVLIGIKEGMKLFLPKDIAMLYDFLRYFILAFFAAFIAPLAFKVSKI